MFDSGLVIGIVAAVVVIVVVVVLVLTVRARRRKKRAAHQAQMRARNRQRAAAEEPARAEEVPEQEPQGEPPLTPEDIEELLDEPALGQSDQQQEVYNSQTVFTQIDAPEPCGFDFSDVVEGYRTKAGHSDGVEAQESHTVYASGANFEKIRADIYSIKPLLDMLSSEGPKQIYGATFPDNTKMIEKLRPFGFKDSRNHGVENLAVITVHGLNKFGKVLEHPVTVRAVTVRRGGVEATDNGGVAPMLDSMVIDLSYLPDGTADAGRIVRWKGRNGYSCEFKWNGFTKNYRPITVKKTDSPGSWTTTFGV